MTTLDTYRQQILSYIESERTEFTHNGVHVDPEWPQFTETANDDFVEFEWNAPEYPGSQQVGVTITSDGQFPTEISYLVHSKDGHCFDGHLPFVPGALAMLVAYIIENAPKKG